MAPPLQLLLCGLWAVCADPAWAHVYRLPPFQHAPGPLVARETFKPVPHKSPLPQGLSALLLPAPGRQPHGDTGPSPSAGLVDVWCGLRRVGVRVDRRRLRYWNDPRLFRLGSCGVSGASRRYLYFHRGLKECGGSGQMVNGQLVYSFILTYAGPRHGSVLRAPPLNMVLNCHYNRFHYSYRVGFQPQAPPSTFVKSVRSQNSFSLSVCNSEWEVLAPEHHFLLGEPVFFIARTGPLRSGERLYVDSCHVTSSSDPASAPRLDIINNFGCMVDSTRADSNSHFYSRGASEVRFSVDSLLFRAEDQMLFLHCSMSVELQPSPSSKSCTFNKASGRWLELEASPSLCSCCDSVCVAPNRADGSTVSSAAWLLEHSAHNLHHHSPSVFSKSGQGLTEELQPTYEDIYSKAVSKKDDLHQGLPSVKSEAPDLTKDVHEEVVDLKSGRQGLTKELHEEVVDLKSGGKGLTKELHEEVVDLKSGGPGLMKELHEEAQSLKSRGLGLEKEQHEEAQSIKSEGLGLTKELQKEAQSLNSVGPGLTVEQHEEAIDLKSGGPGLTVEQHKEAIDLKSGGPGLTVEQHKEAVDLKSGGPGLTVEQHKEAVSVKSRGPDLIKELQEVVVDLKSTLQALKNKLPEEAVNLKMIDPHWPKALDQGAVPLKMTKTDLTEFTESMQLREGDHTAHSQEEDTDEQPQRDITLSKSDLTNHTAAQIQTVTAADVSL